MSDYRKFRKAVTPEIALQAYLAMGVDRTLDLLAAHLWETHGEDAPARSTLGRWSAKKDERGMTWNDRMIEHEDQVAAELNRKLIAKKAAEQFDMVKELEGIAEKTIVTVRKMLTGESADVRALMLEGSVGELNKLLSTAIEASKHIQLLTGGVTDRSESVRREILPEADDVELARRYAAYVERSRKTAPAGAKVH